ncbi:MAG: hydroxyacid dehydrogenase [Deltaproteobacteria bacterium]|nr:hydroxyacid dehydrogenase [Deltaproteobacteria bacterium]
MAYKILISDKIEPVCSERFREAGYHADERSGLSREELLSVVGDYHGLVVRSATKVDSDVLRRGAGGNLKIVGRAGAGLDNVDVAAASALGVRVVNTPGLNANAVAELVVALMIALSRHLWPAMESMKAGRWEKKGLAGHEIRGKTLGLLGLGAVGGLVAAKGIGLGMKVLASDPLLDDAKIASLGVGPAGFEELFASSDYISLHLPLVPGTADIVDSRALALVKPGAYLINCARGGLVEEAALLDALREKRLAGAAVDVYRSEPPDPSPLMSLPNFVAVPHLGASTVEAQLAVAGEVADLVVNFLDESGGPSGSGRA